MPKKLNLIYPDILKNFGRHLVEGRTESRAFLGWFLEHYYRLDETEAQDAICDGPDDKGIDGIYVDSNLERIDVFQTKLYQKENKTLGDVALKEFVGTLSQLSTKEAIENLVATTGNLELRELIKASDVIGLIEKGYKVRGLFITNALKDHNANSYLQQTENVFVYDGRLLDENWVPPGTSAPVHTRVAFRLDGHTPIEYKTPDATVYVAPLLATQLVGLAGLQSGELFAWNVRQALGRTKVNKAIADSVNDTREHKNFLLYHNGLTVLAEVAEYKEDQLIIDGYSVVNGCQSLTTLYENKSKITDELRLLARIIKLPPQNELAAKITRHSNNQNSISARDMQSNSTIQRRLQTEFRLKFNGIFDYEIKRGESTDGAVVITNEEAARLLLAFDLQQPWSCHQSYRLFDELHSEIFGRPEVSATRIVAVWSLHEAVIASLPSLNDKIAGSYRLMQFFLLFVLRNALELDEAGKKFLANPAEIFESIGVVKLKEVTKCIVEDLIVDLNAEVEDRFANSNPFDYKRELKSPTAVRGMLRQILPSYQKAIKRDRATSFGVEVEKIKANLQR